MTFVPSRIKQNTLHAFQFCIPVSWYFGSLNLWFVSWLWTFEKNYDCVWNRFGKKEVFCFAEGKKDWKKKAEVSWLCNSVTLYCRCLSTTCKLNPLLKHIMRSHHFLLFSFCIEDPTLVTCATARNWSPFFSPGYS